MSPASGLMVCGTGSDSGKSTLVTALCRVLARDGVRVAPFKAQNMALNSAVTAGGHEIGRAQAAQASAAMVEPEVAMNPVLLKPTDHRTSQVVVAGRPWAVLDAATYQRAKDRLWPVVLEHLDDLRARFDVVVCEGAGSPAEINLLEHDITNLRVADAAGFPAIVVGDIDRGGVFASLFGTVSLLPPGLSRLVRGFVINKFRGDPALLGPGIEELAARTAIPTIGVVPWLERPGIDAEDSLALRSATRGSARPGSLDVAVVAFPRLSNFTDLDPLALEPHAAVRLVDSPSALGAPDLVILPGSKSTVADLGWLRRSGLADAVCALSGTGTTVLGICGGYQMLGLEISDDVESPEPTCVRGLGLLPVSTVFAEEKVTRRVSGTALGLPVTGYEIHHGRTAASSPWIAADRGPEGSRAGDGSIAGTSVHGLFEADGFRRAFLADVAARAGKRFQAGDFSFAEAREAEIDLLADAVSAHVDMQIIRRLIEAAAP